MIALLLVLAPQLVGAVTQRCEPNSSGARSSRTAHCQIDVDLNDQAQTQVVCIVNPPLSLRTLLSGKLLRLFDSETFRVHQKRLLDEVDFRAASEDTWLTGFTNVTTSATAEEQVRAAFKAVDNSGVQYQLEKMRRVVQAAWNGGGSSTYAVTVSPFGTSCIGLRALSASGAGQVKVEVYREGPLSSESKKLLNGGGVDAYAALGLWAGPLLLFAGVVLFAYAGTLAHSIVFHYASGVSLAMLLGVLIVAILIWRTGRRRLGGVVFTVLGLTWSTVGMYAREAFFELGVQHWPYVLLYFAFFALLGYALTFWRLKGGRPEGHEVALLAFGMRLVAAALIFISSHSLRASFSLLIGAVSIYGAPGSSSPLALGVRMVSRVSAKAASLRGPAGAPTEYDAGDGTPHRWRPPTQSGRYLSEAEFQAEGEIATDNSLKELFASPQYQRWLMANHQRIALAEDSSATRRIALDSDDDFDED